MKFSERWLREWIDPAVDTDELAAQLTRAGLEVDNVEAVVSGALDKVVVARVVSAIAHPDAEKLRVCEVDVGDEPLLSIVCGAPNARAGLFVPLAMIGARLADGKKIRRSKIRGLESHGMLCSARELGLGDEAGGLLELDTDLVPGQSIVDVLQLDDRMFEIDLTPNRGDCLYLEGLARDVAAVNGERVEHRTVVPVAASCTDVFAVQLQAPQICPRYVGRVIRGVNPKAATPLWMIEKLRRCGVRSLGPVVDVTNFVMLELGHPMHAFDLNKLSGAVIVRHAQDGESLKLLDDSEHVLSAEDLVIADQQRAVALAGIMGGALTAVSEATVDVFVECAWFEPRSIAGTCRRLGMHTDASHRFERHVNAHGQARAIERATELLLSMVGGHAGPLVDTVQVEHLPCAHAISLREQRIRRLLGTDVPAPEVQAILHNLHLDVRAVADGWSVTPPPFRPDLTIEADLIEEVARVRGLDSIIDIAPIAALQMRAQPESRRDLRGLRHTLIARGYQEAITYSFVDRELQERMDGSTVPIALSNPISSDMSVMRTSLLPGLLQAALYNMNRQQQRVRLFETGLVFRDVDGVTEQPERIAGIAVGQAQPVQWGERARDIDFYDVKADVAALFGPIAASVQYSASTHPVLHPGQCAELRIGEVVIGVIGHLHPELIRAQKLSAAAVAFELDLQAVLAGEIPAFAAFSRQPTVLRDLSIVVAESISADQVLNCVGQAGGDVLKNLVLFDVYRGEGIDSGHKSLALSLTFQAPSRTLDETEVETSVTTILHSLAKHLGGALRG
jgi:phenylalanyl-tRNA synthetase beta chain